MATLKRTGDSLEPKRNSGNPGAAPPKTSPAQRSAGAGRDGGREGGREPMRRPPQTQPPRSVLTDPRLQARGRRGFTSVLRNRYFLRLWAAQLISQTILNAANYGLIVLIAQRSDSLFATAGSIVAFSLPALLFSAPAGVLVDRLDRRAVLWISNILRALFTFAFVVTLFIDPKLFVPAYGLSFVIATIGQFFTPAEGASIPTLVHEDELFNALALFNVTFTLAQAAGLVLFGPAILLVTPTFHLGTAQHGFDVQPIESLFFLIGVLYLVCTLLILAIPSRVLGVARGGPASVTDEETTLATLSPSASAAQQLRSIGSGVEEAWRFIRRDSRLFISVMQISLGGSIVAVIAMIAPSFVTAFLHQPPASAALIFMPAGVGLVLGSVLAPTIVRRLRYGPTLIIGFIGLAVCMGLLTLTRSVARAVEPERWTNAWQYVLSVITLTFLLGVALDFVNVPAQALMQERSPDWIKGRVLALQTVLLNAVTVPIVLVMGVVGDALGLAPAINILAVVVLLAGLLSVFYEARTRRGARGA